jgi:hypothetical protein
MISLFKALVMEKRKAKVSNVLKKLFAILWQPILLFAISFKLRIDTIKI